MSLTRDVYKNYQAAGKQEGLLPLPENSRVLEVGFGDGKLLEALRERGNDVYGVDVSERLVEQARLKGFEHVLLLDVSETPLPFEDDFFDAVFCYEVFEHLTNPHRLFFEVRRTLKQGHYFLFSVPAQEIDMGYGINRHTFIYPGLLEKENLERFIMQMYFRIDHAIEPGPHDHLLGRNYALCNMKRPDRTDVVEVIIQDRNVCDLYGDFLTPERLEKEIAREVGAYLVDLEEAVIAGDWSRVTALLDLLCKEYPVHFPMYPRIARLLFEAGKPDVARGILSIVKEFDQLPSTIREEMELLLASYDSGSPPR